MQRQIADMLRQQALQNSPFAAKPKNLAPLEDGVLRAFRLQHIAPDLLARTLESFLGENQLRLVPDLVNNMLIVYAKENVLEQISELVETLDQNPDSQYESDEEETIEAQSLLIRIFWLANGLPEGEGSDPYEYLPDSVIEAVGQLGLQEPRLVTQSSTSVYAEVDDATDFHFYFPAFVLDEALQFQSRGELFFQHQSAYDPPMLMLELGVEVQGESNLIELAGKLSAPLGHYMVLGTTNYATEHVGESRFAFVVQIIEAKSYAPEKESSESLDSEK
ncbi:MAG: hypothetical protein GXP26_02085 [Planctomycetes bacterium]|nr:hypothetical protein [Planctomycetota bacterium]